MRLFAAFELLFAFLLLRLGSSPSSSMAAAWKSCSEDAGGGTCPDETTCCPTQTPGVSACIPLVHTAASRRAGTPNGQCCGDDSSSISSIITTSTSTSSTGCRFGYECAVSTTTAATTSSTSSVSVSRSRETMGVLRVARLGSKRNRDIPRPNQHYYCKATNESLVFDPLARDTPRYDLCQIPEDTKKLYGFPVAVSPNLASHNITTSTASTIIINNNGTSTNENEKDDGDNDIFHLAYFSNVGSIASQKHSIGDVDNDDDEPNNDRLETVEKAVIVIHGSLRDAEDYFCAGLSLIEGGNNSNNNNDRDGTTMIIAPKFASVNDNMEEHGTNNKNYRFLVWEEQVEANDEFLWHIWRYGPNAANAPISSYTALDNLVEHLVTDTARFPNLQQITVVGHSAGGQTVQRWALLSNSPAWNTTSTVGIRAVVANPRSYAYLDGRRWLAPSSNPKEQGQNNTTTNDETKVFRRPTAANDGIDAYCPWYNHWLWGLEDGGELSCPYRDSAVAQVGSAAAIAKRYASRNVIYLSGEYDTVPQPNDRCGNAIQGGNRHERAIRFYTGLQEYFGTPVPPVHTFHTIPHSNHDHSLMFQSALGKDAILGLSTDKP